MGLYSQYKCIVHAYLRGEARSELIFGTALKAAASGIIISHNHPSGNLKPSDRDKDVTKKIRDAGEMLDIKLMDHIIVGHEGQYLSLSDEGL